MRHEIIFRSRTGLTTLHTPDVSLFSDIVTTRGPPAVSSKPRRLPRQLPAGVAAILTGGSQGGGP